MTTNDGTTGGKLKLAPPNGTNPLFPRHPDELAPADLRHLRRIRGEMAKQAFLMAYAARKAQFGEELAGGLAAVTQREFAAALHQILLIKNHPGATDEEREYLEEFAPLLLSTLANSQSRIMQAGLDAIEAQVTRDARVAESPLVLGLFQRAQAALLGSDPDE